MKKVLRSKYTWIITVLVIVVGVVIFFRSKTNTNGQESAINPKQDEVVSVEVTDIQQDLTLSGQIDALTRSDVRFQSSGLLTWVGVKEGDKVRKWQALASLDRKELQKNLETQFNDYRKQLSQFDDTQDEYKTERDALVLTDEMKRILNRSQFDLNNAVIQYELSDLAIKYSTVYSPIAGIVTAIDQPVAGVHVTPASATFTVIDPSTVYFKSEVEQDDISKIKIGQTAVIELDSYPDETINGTIDYISFTPMSGRSTPTYAVRIKFPVDNQSLKYRLGMDGDATIALSQASNTIVIPFEALVEEDDKSYVYVKDPKSNTAIKKEVQTGLETTTEIEITQGLNSDDQVVIKAK